MRCLLIIILAVVCAISPMVKETYAKEPLINMNVYEAEARDVLFALADMGEVNILIDDSVQGTVTVQLKNVSFATALDLVTKVNGLTYHREGNIIVVADARVWADTFGQIHFFRINYADAAVIAQELLLLFPQKEQLQNSTRTTQNQGEFIEIDDAGINNRNFKERVARGTVTATGNSASVTTNIKNTDNIRLDRKSVV
jgi:hypothetical protein